MAESNNIKVLVVDDEPSLRTILGKLLSSSGYDVFMADDGHQALQQITEREFDVVLLDIRMPGLSGMDVLRNLHGDFPETTVVMITAVVDMATAVEAMQLGAYDYITKPFDLDDVLNTVGKAWEVRKILLEKRDYQSSLEQEVAEKTAHLEQKVHEIDALNGLIQSRLNQVFATKDTYERVAREIAALERQFKELAEAANLSV